MTVITSCGHHKNGLEVEKINNYAIFMGYLLMGVRGLGFLVFTWTTVVLLGGFVSTLQKKDFWCLTAITLVQTAGVFDFLLSEKSRYVLNSFKGLLYATSASVLRPFRKKTDKKGKPNKYQQLEEPSIARKVLASVLALVQELVVAIILCPLAVLYVLGPYVSTGISLWRLIQQDYGSADGGANLNPALNVLYSLALAQGAIYGYWTIYYFTARTGLAKQVTSSYYYLETDWVSDYLEETVAGCMKDPSFARGRNFVTYAVDLLMESKLRYGYISGVLILGTLEWNKHAVQMKELLTGSTSFSHVVQRLVETFGPTSPYSTEIRVKAARIVTTVAGSIRLDHFPQGMVIECISSLLDTPEEYSWRPEGYKRNDWLPKEYERDWLLDDQEYELVLCDDSYKIPSCARATDSNTQQNGNPLQGYKSLVVQGLRILKKLAINEHNCRVMSNTEGLLSKTMAPLISDKLHGDHHDDWSIVAEESLEFMNQLLIATLGGSETKKLTREISSSSQAIMRTLGCYKCHMSMKRKTAQVLLHLSPDTPLSIVPGATGRSSIIFLWILLDIFLLPDYHFVVRIRGATHLLKKSTTRLVGQKMQAMMVPSITEASDTSMLPSAVGEVIGSLARTVAGAENNAYRIEAATILRHLCKHYTMDDENLKELKKAIASAMPEVLKEIVHWLTTEEIEVVTEANNGDNVLLAEGLDLEQGGVPLSQDDNGQESSSTPHQQKGEKHQGIIQLQEALIDLCQAIRIKWIDADQDLTRQFNEIAAKIYSGQGMPEKPFRSLLGEAKDKLRLEKRAVRTS